MKKKILVLCLLTAAVFTVSAGDFNPGEFVIGKWIDSNYDAVWEFTGDNIRILTLDESDVYYDFKDKTIEDFTIGVKDKMPSLSFFCRETGKEYTFKKPLTGKDLVLEIIPPSKNFYSVKMKYK